MRMRGLVLGALACLVLGGPLLGQEPAAPRDRPPGTEAERWRADLRFMAEQMPKRHRQLFHTTTREEFDRAVGALEERIPSLARHQIVVEMARIVALAGDGHTNIAPTRDPKVGFRTYPVALYLFKDGLYVRSADRAHADLVGSRVLKIGRATVDEALDAVRPIIGRDNEMGVKFFAPFLLVMPEVVHALGLVSDMERAEVTVEDHGRPRVVALKPAGPAEMMAPDSDLSWLPKAGWVDARDGAPRPTPLWLKDPQNKYWFEYLPASRAVYVQFNQVGNKAEETIAAFADRLLAFVEANPVDRLILDLRLNRGGNGALNRPLLLGIIRARKIDQRGRLFTIVGRGTWSAAQMLVNDLERYTSTLFVGEPTSGKANSYGDSHRITLPNSQLTVRVSTLWWQGDERDRRPWTAPQVAAELTFEDYRTNHDPALEACLGWAPRPPLVDLLAAAVSAGGLERATERYREWRRDPANLYVDTEAEVNGLGYELMAKQRLDQAVAIFRLNAAAYPDSANAYDSLADAYLAAGDRQAAASNYEKALALNPRMPSALDALEKLRRR